MKNNILTALVFTFSLIGFAQQSDQKLNKKVIQWRHEIHQIPELSNREFKTAEKVAAHLKSLGMEV